MITRNTLDKTVNSSNTRKDPCPDGIPNEIIDFLPDATRSALFFLLFLLARKAYTPPNGATTPLASYTKGDPTLLDNYRPIALINSLPKLWTALIKGAGSKYAETHRILNEQQDGFRLLRSIHDALASIIMMMVDVKTYSKDIYIMYADFKGAFNAADHLIMLKHMRQLCMPSTFVDTCEQLYCVSSTDYITPYGPYPSIDTNRGTLQGDTLSPFLEPFLRWLAVGSRGYRHGAHTTNDDPIEPTATIPGHGLADHLSLATGSPTNMTIQLKKLSLVSAYTGMRV
jgi:hypothetical protein